MHFKSFNIAFSNPTGDLGDTGIATAEAAGSKAISKEWLSKFLCLLVHKNKIRKNTLCENNFEYLVGDSKPCSA